MRKQLKTILLACLTLSLSLSSSIITFAGQWQKDNVGWWYQFDDKSYPTNTWVLAPVADGSYHYYYFNEAGYMLENTTTPDGLTVGADGSLANDDLGSERIYYSCDIGQYRQMCYDYVGDLIPDTDTFHITCEVRPEEPHYYKYTFYDNGTYKCNHYYDEVSQNTSWVGTYKRNGNLLSLANDEGYGEFDIIYNRLWTH